MPRLVVGEGDESVRLDVYLGRQDDVGSRAHAQRLIDEGLVTVSRGRPRKNMLLAPGDVVEYHARPRAENRRLIPEPVPVDVVYEDQDILVVCKPAGLVVHPAAGHDSGTLVNRLIAHTELASKGGPFRPGIVHRLDKDTSGLLIVAKNDLAYDELVRMIKRREVSRVYIALARGRIAEGSGVIEAPLGRLAWDRKRMGVTSARSKRAVTKFRVIKRSKDYTLLRVALVTGRTHQIRAHLAFIGHSVVGDPIYGQGRKDGLERQFLHAYELRFYHPITRSPMTLRCELPQELRDYQEKISWSD